VVQGIEASGTDRPKAYERSRDKLVDAIGEGGEERRHKTNRVGVEGCCGRGCNGCLMFWQDPQYEKARGELLKRKQGAQLSRAEAKALKLPAAE
jgi:putative protease